VRDAYPEKGERNDMLEDKSLIPIEAQQPPNIFVLPLLNLVPLPGMVFPINVRAGRTKKTIERSLDQDELLGLFFATPSDKSESKDKITAKDLYSNGVLAKIIRRIKLPDGNWSVFVQCLQRIHLDRVIRETPYFLARVSYLKDEIKPSRRIEALLRNVGRLVNEYIQAAPGLPEEIGMSLMNIHDPGALSDFVGGHFPVTQDDRLYLLKTLNVVKRLERISRIMLKEIELAKLGSKINEDLRSKIEERQKEFILREQIKLIRKELGEEKDEREELCEKYEAKVKELEMPEDVAEKVRHEIDRMSMMVPEAAEFHVIRSYLDWLTSLPWNIATRDLLNVKRAQKILEEDHYGLDDVKKRILEFLAVRKIKADRKGSILCFLGPPGVGKTSLGKSIARAMGRKFYRFSLGGMRDEAEIKGHRRTYVGAMPGKIIQSIKSVKSKNPVLMLDEVDKVGSDWRGDPSSALLEVLDPEQNNSFLDNYLDVQFDLSHVFFIATANVYETIPKPLLDRMEVIEIAGYLPEEKVEIARRYLMPRQLEQHGLNRRNLTILRKAMNIIVTEYTRESGVRGLEREIARVCRKVAMRVAAGKKGVSVKIADLKDVHKYLGAPKVVDEISDRIKRPGVAVGLAWTPTGGQVLCIETMRMKGKGRLQLTGQLGDIMNESARIAVSYVRSHSTKFGLSADVLEDWDLHIHFPAGAIKKDGPSAGITIISALISLLSNKTIKPRLAMTGEVTLTGNVLAVGGIREKVVAARRHGIKTVIVPASNRKNIQELKKDLTRGIRFVYAKTYHDVYKEAFK
jgi:ATP-dependent Lon protease